MVRELEAALGGERFVTLGQFLAGNQDVGLTTTHIDTNAVTRLQDGETATGRSFGRCIEDGRAARCAGLAAVTDAGQRIDAFLQEIIRRAHVHHFRCTRITDRACTAHEEDGVGVDAERRIVDAVVVIFRTIEHYGAAFEGLRIVRVGEVTVAEFFRNHARLHDGGGEQVAAQNAEACTLLEWLVVRTDDLFVFDDGATAIVADGLAVDGHRVFLDEPLGHQLVDDCRNAAGMVIVLTEIFTCWLQVDKQRHVFAIGLPVIDGQFDADMACKAVQMDRRVGGATNGRVDADGVDEGILGHDV
ncbi:hypothetical protein D3C78_913520 [compost metagenome]